MTTAYIATAQMPQLGGHAFLPGDLVDFDAWRRRGDCDERTAAILIRQTRVKELTPENFSFCLAQRPAGSPKPAGFTDQYLIDKGIIDAPMPVPVVVPKPGREVISQIEHTAETVKIDGYFLTPRKAGPRLIWDLTNAEGVLMRAKGFQSVENAAKFIATLSTSTSSESSGNGGTSQEAPDGSDVRSNSAGSDQPGAVPPGGHGASED